MRTLSLLALALAACGAKSTTTGTTTPGSPTGATTTASTAPDTSVCANRPDQFGPVKLDDTQAAQRYGSHAAHFADVSSSQAQPIEVCGVGGEMQWLKAVTCADGSNPYGQNPDDVRAGDTGPGGRCGSIIDLYPAKCPEATYQVYMDMYMCAPGETFM